MERGESRRWGLSVLPIANLLVQPSPEILPKFFGKRGGRFFFRIIQRFEEFASLFLAEVIRARAKLLEGPLPIGGCIGPGVFEGLQPGFELLLGCKPVGKPALAAAKPAGRRIGDKGDPVSRFLAWCSHFVRWVYDKYVCKGLAGEG